MSKIFFMKEEAIESLLSNVDKVKECIINNPHDTRWLEELCGKDYFEEQPYEIDDFKLLSNEDYSKVDFQNSVMIYEKLKHLPRFVLMDKRFWCWFEFSIGYEASQCSIPLKQEIGGNPIKNMWLFSEGHRRSLFFNVMARCFLRVELTVDNSIEDKYKYTRFVIEKSTRISELTWRSFSNNKELVYNIVRAEYDFYQQYGEEEHEWYRRLPKDISYLASVKFIDTISAKDIYDFVYNKLLQYKKEQ